tara:strand:- start:4385 stop:4756 length:372 start_codon:yes stop_codon:yes gene_type:complete
MIKSVFAAVAALSVSAGAAVAGPYVNVETNAGWAGDDYTGAVTDLHVGFEGPIGDSAAWYVQGGPAIVSPDGAESSTEFSGKVGASAALTDSVGVYGELSAITSDQEFDDLSVGGKLGVKYSF